MGVEEDPLERTDLRVEKIMVRDTLTVGLDNSIGDAARGMESCGCGCCLVEAEGKIVGIVTERDIVRRVAAKGLSIQHTKVRDIMSKPLIVVAPNTPLRQALEVMTLHKIRRLPVVDKKELVGIVSLGDIARAIAERVDIMGALLKAMARMGEPPKELYI